MHPVVDGHLSEVTLGPWKYAYVRGFLATYRAQVLREAATEIRTWHDRLPGEHECCDANAANLIDPDVKVRTSDDE
jgi:hypothetical protein